MPAPSPRTYCPPISLTLSLLLCLPAFGDGATGPDAPPGKPPAITIAVCWGYGCANRDSVTIDRAEWDRIRRQLMPPATDPVGERRQVGRAIAEFEHIVGPKTGTDADKGGTFPGLFRDGQMDCIDESSNTTTYLELLAAHGLLRWHKVGADTTRGYFVFGWPHTTATLQEKATGKDYAVDSWFFDNGAAPVIIPLEQWRGGWNPPAP